MGLPQHQIIGATSIALTQGVLKCVVQHRRAHYAAHKHPKVLEWIENHPRFVFHFTPTSASWLNAVESFFAKLTKKRLKRGVFRSLQDLKDAIHRFLDRSVAGGPHELGSAMTIGCQKHNLRSPDVLLRAVAVGHHPPQAPCGRRHSIECWFVRAFLRTRTRESAREIPKRIEMSDLVH